MAMFLMIVGMSIFGLVVMALAVSAGGSGVEGQAEVQPHRAIEAETPRFFGRDIAMPARSAGVPIEVLLGEIERHVRLEQAAAETFLEHPATESLHTPTASPFVN